MIERGRWSKVESQDRLCTVCNVVESEYHCLSVCPRYANQRMGRLSYSLQNNPSMYEFVMLMRSKSFVDIKNVGLLSLAVQIEHNQYI